MYIKFFSNLKIVEPFQQIFPVVINELVFQYLKYELENVERLQWPKCEQFKSGIFDPFPLIQSEVVQIRYKNIYQNSDDLQIETFLFSQKCTHWPFITTRDFLDCFDVFLQHYPPKDNTCIRDLVLSSVTSRGIPVIDCVIGQF